MILTWSQRTNIENSIIDFLRSEVNTDSLKLLDGNGVSKTVNVYAGRTLNHNWNLPLIQVYLDSSPDLQRLQIGGNQRLKSYQIIVEIRTNLPGQETNLADWVESCLNEGITIYSYSPNSSNLEAPIKTTLGHGRVDFISSLPVPLFDDADIYDQNRYRLTLKIWLNS